MIANSRGWSKHCQDNISRLRQISNAPDKELFLSRLNFNQKEEGRKAF